MHDAATRNAICTFLREITLTLQKASGVAKAADFFAQRGDLRKGTEIALEIEQLAYDATTTLDAIRFLKRRAAHS
jgi:hypothetical protein